MYRGLLAKPDGCDKCPLNGCPQVPGEGDPHAKIVIVGMGPGYFEEQRGRPFCGNSGELLDRMLKAANIERSEVWITNVALCRPDRVQLSNGGVIPKARVEKDSMLKHCRARVLKELALVKSRVVVALGTITAEAICDGVKGITQLHGALCHLAPEAGCPNTIVIPLFHPAHLLRGEQRFYPAVVEGLKKAKRLSESPPRQLGKLFVIDPCSARVDADLDQLESLVLEVLESGEDIAVDVETTSEKQLDATLTVVGFGIAGRGTRPAMGVAVTVRSWNNAKGCFEWLWSASQWQRVHAILLRLLLGSNRKIYWNWGFDVTVLERFFGLPGGTVRDGMILHHLDYPDLLHRLDFAVQTVLDAPPWKYIYRDKCKRGVATHRDLLIYNAQDCLYTILAFLHVEMNARLRGNLHLERRQLEVSCLARRAHIFGVPINMRVWQEVYDEHRRIHDDALIMMRGAIASVPGAAQDFSEFVDACRRSRSPGKDIQPSALGAEDWNPNSGDHGRWFLYEFLKLQPQRWTKGGPDKDKTKIVASASYKGVLVFSDKPLVKAYVDCAEESATIRTLESIRANVNPRTGRVHPSWQTTSMKGTRWTSSGGLNVQNWDETLKHVTRFEEEGPPSYWWVAADAAAIEYRIAAWLANIQELLDLFNGETFDEEKEEWKKYDPRYDAHSLVAVEVFGDMFTKGNMKLKKALRTMVKRVVYALFYGAYPEKIFQTILEDKRVPSEFRAFIAKHKDYIERIHSGFSSRFGEWERYAQRQIAQVRFKEEQIIAPFGRHRPWALSNMVEETKIRNTPIQLSAGEIINDIFVATDKALRAVGVDAHFSIHEHDSEKYVVHARDVVKAQGIMNDEFDRWLEFGGDDEIVRKIHITGQAHTGLSLASV